MAVIVEGTTLGTCDTIYAEGSAVESVSVNGTTVWARSCGPSCDFLWSNDTLAAGGYFNNCPGSGERYVDGCGVKVSTDKKGLSASYYDIEAPIWYHGFNHIFNSNCSVGVGSAETPIHENGVDDIFYVNFNVTKITVSRLHYDAPVEAPFGEITFNLDLVNFSYETGISMAFLPSDIIKYYGLTTSGGAIMAFSRIQCAPGDVRTVTGSPMWAVSTLADIDDELPETSRLHFSWNEIDQSGLIVNSSSVGDSFNNKPDFSFEYDSVSFSNWICSNNYLRLNGEKRHLTEEEKTELSAYATNWIVKEQGGCNADANN